MTKIKTDNQLPLEPSQRTWILRNKKGPAAGVRTINEMILNPPAFLIYYRHHLLATGCQRNLDALKLQKGRRNQLDAHILRQQSNRTYFIYLGGRASLHEMKSFTRFPGRYWKRICTKRTSENQSGGYFDWEVR